MRMTIKVSPPSDRDLDEINKTLDWFAATALPDGRVLGRLGRRKGKRDKLQALPDRRIKMLDERIGLTGKRVLEIGCFEGVHTAGLARLGAEVTALDVRPANVMKTLTRLAYHGENAQVLQADAEALTIEPGAFDVVFHFGVLYHLVDPVAHLMSLKGVASFIYLDTHIAPDGASETISCASADGSSQETYEGAFYKEGGWRDPFSGKGERAFWLTKPALFQALAAAGFAHIDEIEHRDERNGARILLAAMQQN